MSFNFGEVLTRAWQIIWKHRVLWIFGILASCGRGGGGGNGGGGNSGFNTSGSGPDVNLPPQLEQFVNWVAQNVTSFIVITIALVCVIWVVAIFLSTIGKIGLIRGTWQAEGGTDRLVLGQLFSESTPFFWRMFGLSVVVGLPFALLVAVVAAGFALIAISASQGSDAAGLGFLASLPLLIGCLCLLVPVGFVVNMIVRQAQNAIVLEDAGVLPSLSRGWDIFRGNLGPIIVMAIILAVLGLVAGFIIAIPVFIVVLPAVLTFMAGDGQNWTPLAIMGVCLCLYIPVSLLLNGIIVAFTEAAWTLTYLRIARPQDNAPVIIEANA
jgi:hypothetical protein